MRHSGAESLNEGWRFRLGDLPPWSESSGWHAVVLPHSWNALDTMEVDRSKHYARAVGWYAREFSSPAPDQRLWLEFEAASQRASIWLNGAYLGEHPGGYTAFTCEVKPQLEGISLEEPLTLALRVDNLLDPSLIPSDMSDFFLAGGLTRNAWCYITGPRRLANLRCEAEVCLESATLTIHGQLDSSPAQALHLQIELFSPEGRSVCQRDLEITQASFVLPALTLPQPELWSPDHPALYQLRLTLQDERGKVWDAVVERLGLRFFSFPAGGTCLLNGEPLVLRGTHRHEDWAGYASAVPDELTWQEMRQIKAAGLNFVRLAHYPQSSTVLDACDELGLLVWEELPWCRGGVGGELFQARALAMFAEMLEQHYNHPSIVLWGLGNELDWESEHPASTDEQVCAFLQTLHEFAHARDPQRLTALRRFVPGARIVDVYSPSIWSGWYRGRYEDYEDALTRALALYPRMLHMEWGGDSHYGRHSSSNHLAAEVIRESDHAELPGLASSSEGPARGSRDSDWSESYILDIMEWHLQVQARTSRLAGGAQWSFKDFGTPLRPENPIPYVNQKGLLDRAGRPKDLFYLFQSYLTNTPVCHIESPTWRLRTGQPGELQRVRVYSNCARIALFLNQEDLGERQRDSSAFPAAGLVWWVAFRTGLNTLRAVGVSEQGQHIEQNLTVEYNEALPGPGAAFRWRTEAAGTLDGREGTRVLIQLVDAEGVPVVDDRRRIEFALQGTGTLYDRLGIVGGSRVIELANGQASIIILSAGTATLHILVDDLPTTIIPL